MSQLGTLLTISKGKCCKIFRALRAQRNVYFKGQIDVFDYFCAKREEIFEVLCISKGKLTAFFRAKRAENFQDFQGQTKVFGTFYARSAKKILRVFKGKMRFLAPFRAKREKILGYPEGSQIGTPENPPLLKS